MTHAPVPWQLPFTYQLASSRLRIYILKSLRILMAGSLISKEAVISEAPSSVSQLIDMIPMDSQNMLVLSLGTGAAKQEF